MSFYLIDQLTEGEEDEKKNKGIFTIKIDREKILVFYLLD